MSISANSAMEFEDILVQVGDFGRYQKTLMLVFLYPVSALLPWFTMNILFMLSVPEHWCRVPQLDSFNLTLQERFNLTRPPSDPSCTVYDVNYTEILSSENSTIPEGSPTKFCDQGWEFDKTNYDSTAATQWNMFCTDGHYVSMILTLASVGGIIGTPFYGALADRFGRKPTFFFTVFITCVTGIISILMTDFTAFAVFRLLNGTIMPSIFQIPYIILLEVVGPTMRTRINAIANVSWTCGLCLLPLIAWLSRGWVVLGLITSSVTVPFLAYWKILPESPRWLLSRGKYAEATEIMAKIADKNGSLIEKEFLSTELKNYGERTKKEEQKMINSVDKSPNTLMKYPKLRNSFLIITLCWIANKAGYYGLLLNVPNLNGNEFLNFFLLSIVEIPAFVYSWWFMEAYGRRWCAVLNYILTAISCLVPVFFPDAGVVPSLLGKFFVSASFMTMYQQCAELYPTTLRSLGMGMSGTIAEIVTLGVPYIVYLAVYGKYIPFLVFATVCALAGVFASFLPETLNENLPQTAEDCETFAVHQRFFSCNRKRRPSCYEHNIDYPMQDIAKRKRSHT